MNDKRQAIMDAIEAIITANTPGNIGPGLPPLPAGNKPIDIEVDPELFKPESKQSSMPPQNLKINDPENLLGQQKQDQKEENDSAEPQGHEGKGQQDQQSSESEGSQQSSDSKGSNKEQGDSSSSNGSKDKDSKGSHQESNIDNLTKTNEQQKPDADYIKDWNKAIDELDNENTSDADLDDEANNKANSKARQDAAKAIQISRDRPYEVDPSTDPKMKMPKNSVVKQYEEENQESEQDQKKRISRIQKILNDPKATERDLKDIQIDRGFKQADALKDKKGELKKAAGAADQKGVMDFSYFESDLYDAVNRQVERKGDLESSYLKPNATYAGTDFLVPGQIYSEKPVIPEINVYFDRSGSWKAADAQKGLQALKVLSEYEDQHKVIIHLFYFNDHVYNASQSNLSGDGHGGTGAFGEIYEHILSTDPDNVIIMSDDDIEHQGYSAYEMYSDNKKLEVPGVVWFLWRNSRASHAPKVITGEQGTYQYWLN